MSDERTRRIQDRAHALWEREGRPHGRDAQHWSQAEREIAAEDEAHGYGTTGPTAERRTRKPKPVKEEAEELPKTRQSVQHQPKLASPKPLLRKRPQIQGLIWHKSRRWSPEPLIRLDVAVALIETLCLPSQSFPERRVPIGCRLA